MNNKDRHAYFDTSTRCTGFSIFQNGQLINHGVIDLTKMKNYSERVEKMCLEIVEFLRQSSPSFVGVESPPFTNNVDTLKKLCRINGVVYGWAFTLSIPFVEKPPSWWRKRVRSDGQTLPKRGKAKEWDLEKAQAIWPEETFADDNDADACLLGLAMETAFFSGNKKETLIS